MKNDITFANAVPQGGPAGLTDDDLATVAGGLVIRPEDRGCPVWIPPTQPPGNRAPEPRVPRGGSMP